VGVPVSIAKNPFFALTAIVSQTFINLWDHLKKSKRGIEARGAGDKLLPICLYSQPPAPSYRMSKAHLIYGWMYAGF